MHAHGATSTCIRGVEHRKVTRALDSQFSVRHASTSTTRLSLSPLHLSLLPSAIPDLWLT
ncbi:TPA: hypothetical protein N0F65_011265 [Lagenidium giganteum]|uniref:Uncharacterized protein n=1 Tax=Lagenidium giganteum TaxID=4803 RepID=A0AAV2YYA5_9STRA|nr:TPA: hypothetical protein N0F65_011265 [Lagenidium giganteum]